MRRKLRKLSKPKEISSSSSSFQIEKEEPDFQPDVDIPKLLGNQKKKTKSSKPEKGSTQRKEPSLNEDSGNSEILEIRHGDQFVRDHVRPEFLRRWDGESNELELFQSELKELSPMFKVYWPVKARNMKAVVFLEFGKMEYFVFENDAILLSEISKKKLKHWSKFLMCNFWCKEVETVKRELFERRIPVLVMKQIEDPEYRAKNGLVRREVQEVITPAIHPAFETKAGSRERLLLSLYKQADSFGFVVLDSETNQFLVQQIKEDRYLHEVRRIINRYRPVELVISRQNHEDIVQIARQISNPHIVQLKLTIREDKAGNFLRNLSEEVKAPLLLKLRRIFQKESARGEEFSRLRTVMALGLVWQYLQELSMKEKIFNQGLFTEGDGDSFRAPFFDSQVYQNLQLFRVKVADDQTYSQPGTLLHYLDHCRTQQGRKLLHRWLDCPPTNLQDVLERQKAVCQLLESADALKYHDKMIGYQKLSRKLGDIYHWIQRNAERGKVILTRTMNFQKEYDPRKNPAVVRIREIVEVVNCIKEYELFLKELATCDFKSPLLSSKIQLHEIQDAHSMDWETFEDVKGLPAIGYVADAVLRSVVYDQVTGSLEPAPGESEVFDENKKEFQRIQFGLERQLDKWKAFFDSPKVKFVSVRAKNEIQVPKSAIKKDGKTHPHKDLIFSSEIAGAVRYTTAESSSLSEELIQYEESMAQTYEPFLQSLLVQFSRFRGLWDRYVRSSAWIDALMSLAQASKRMGVRCLPQFREKGVSIIGASHPSLSQVLDKVVPNSLVMKEQERVLLLTGPNMGGKSTLLKQTCLLVVLAQLGCYIPALEYSAPVFDQIFCRIGASDRIFEGKSTFYVELQETKLIMNKATDKSLVVIDQLGRGTSTYDGMAIAEAVLNHLIETIRPITLFSTHYTQISERFRSNSKVKLAKMGSDVSEEALIFTYQLEEGVAEKSFATNVVRIVGIDQEIVSKAEQKSQQMHHQTRRKKIMREACVFARLPLVQPLPSPLQICLPKERSNTKVASRSVENPQFSQR